jgi:hypothetical protein
MGAFSVCLIAIHNNGKVPALTAGDTGEQENGTSVVDKRLDDHTERTITRQKWYQITNLTWTSDGVGLLMLAQDQKNSPAQIWQLPYNGGEARRVTNDLNSYSDISSTADSVHLCTVQSIDTSSLWIAPKTPL